MLKPSCSLHLWRRLGKQAKRFHRWISSPKLRCSLLVSGLAVARAIEQNLCESDGLWRVVQLGTSACSRDSSLAIFSGYRGTVLYTRDLWPIFSDGSLCGAAVDTLSCCTLADLGDSGRVGIAACNIYRVFRACLWLTRQETLSHERLVKATIFATRKRR